MKRFLLILRHPIWWVRYLCRNRGPLDKASLVRLMASRNLFEARMAQEQFAKIITPAILEVIEKWPTHSEVWGFKRDSS